MSANPEIGHLVAGRYDVRGRTLAGPAYVDYRVFDREIEVELSLWWMDPTLYGDENPRAAFESGARSVKKLSHPHVRRLYEAGRHGTGIYAALQLGTLDPTLSRLGGGRPGGEMDILRYATALCEGLEAGHSAGYVHGRLVPSDIVEVAGQIKISGIGLYRDRKKSTERRLEETAADLARLEDLIAEVQTQVRSLARQRGRAERYGKMIEERFGIAMTLVRRELEDFDLSLGALGVRARELAEQLPAARVRLDDAQHQREARVQARHTAEARRTEVERRLGDAKLEVGRLESDLALAAERLSNAAQRRQSAADERVQAERRAAQATREHEAAGAERTAAERDLAAVQGELGARTGEEDTVRGRLTAERRAVRELEEALQRRAETARALEIEGGALDRERSELREQLALAADERKERDAVAKQAARDAESAAQRVSRDAQAAVRAVEGLQHARRHVGTLHDQELSARSARRQTEAALAQLEARHDALSELDRQHVGLAPAAQALLKARQAFGDGVLGPLADFVRTSRRDAELAEQLLGDWLHAVLVRDASVIDAVRAWHSEAQPGPLVLLPCVPGPRLGADGHPLQDELRVDGPAAAWVRGAARGPRGDWRRGAPPRQWRGVSRQRHARSRPPAASRRAGSAGERGARSHDQSRARARRRRVNA